MKRISLLLALALLATLLSAFAFGASAADVSVWDGTQPETGAGNYGGGSGTEADPYLISSAEHLIRLSRNTNNGIETDKAYYYKLTCDITLNANYEESATWGTTPPANSFNPIRKGGMWYGHFDGDGHVIRGMYIAVSDSDSWKAVAGFCSGLSGSITNLGFENCYVKRSDEGNLAGVICAQLGNKGAATVATIENVYVADSTLDVFRAGGMIAGRVYSGRVNNVYVTGAVNGRRNGEHDTGGLIGWVDNDYASDTLTITNCYALATITVAGGNAYGAFAGNIQKIPGGTVNISNLYCNTAVAGVKAVGYVPAATATLLPADYIKDLGDTANAPAFTVAGMNLDANVWVDSDNGPVLKAFVKEAPAPETQAPATQAPTTQAPATQAPAASEDVTVPPEGDTALAMVLLAAVCLTGSVIVLKKRH